MDLGGALNKDEIRGYAIVLLAISGIVVLVLSVPSPKIATDSLRKFQQYLSSNKDFVVAFAAMVSTAAAVIVASQANKLSRQSIDIAARQAQIAEEQNAITKRQSDIAERQFKYEVFTNLPVIKISGETIPESPIYKNIDIKFSKDAPGLSFRCAVEVLVSVDLLLSDNNWVSLIFDTPYQYEAPSLINTTVENQRLVSANKDLEDYYRNMSSIDEMEDYLSDKGIKSTIKIITVLDTFIRDVSGKYTESGEAGLVTQQVFIGKGEIFDVASDSGALSFLNINYFRDAETGRRIGLIVPIGHDNLDSLLPDERLTGALLHSMIEPYLKVEPSTLRKILSTPWY